MKGVSTTSYGASHLGVDAAHRAEAVRVVVAFVVLLLTCAVAVSAHAGEADAPPAVAASPPAAAPHDHVTDEEVRLAIQAIVHRLYAMQNGSGHWDHESRPHDWPVVHWGGYTALATCALLTAGESYQDPRLRSAVDFLRRINIIGTYARGVRSHVWGALPDKFRLYHRKDVDWLVDAQHPQYGYHNYTELPRDYYDNSATQYGVLGVWEAAKRGAPVPRRYWHKIEQHFLHTQLDDGAWEYRNQPEFAGPRATMVTAGLACLHITQEYLHGDAFEQPGVARDHPVQLAINRGLDWLGANYIPGDSVGGGPAHYYMYGIERVGLASGYRYFNGRDWYRSGARWIIDHPGDNVVDLSFSLMFLVRGRVPVFVNKLQLPGQHWNNRPRDVAHLIEWVSDEVERQLNWQIVTLDSPVEDWLGAPLVYIASHEPLRLDAADKAKIKRYIDLGGTLVTTADAESPAFTDSVRTLLAELYPQYPPRTLTPDDDVMRVVFQLKSNELGVTTVHNGVRHLALHLPRGDAGWTLHANRHDTPFAWRLLTNAYYHATEMGRTYARLDTPYIARVPSQAGDADTPDVHVTRARYAGTWDPEPLAWRVQANRMHNDARGSVTVSAVDLDAIDEADHRFVHVAGADAFHFTPRHVDAIRNHVERGGVILFETVGGMGPFTESVINMLHNAYRDDPRADTRRLRPLSLNADVLTGVGFPNGHDLAAVSYRPYTLLRMGKTDTPRLMCVMIHGEPRILLAADDLSFGMLNQPRWGVFGYSSDTASRLMSNIALWATHRATPTPQHNTPRLDAGLIAEQPASPPTTTPASTPDTAPPANINATDTPPDKRLQRKPDKIWF